MIDEDTAKIWSGIIEVIKDRVEPRRPGEITVNEFAELTGLSINSARVRLEKLVKDGLVRKRTIGNQDGRGGRINLYEIVRD